jgi:hypothetical protein
MRRSNVCCCLKSRQLSVAYASSKCQTVLQGFHSLHSAAPDVCTSGLSPQQLPGVTCPSGHVMQLLSPPGLYVPLRQGWQYAAPCRTPSPARQTAHDTNKDTDMSAVCPHKQG